MRSVELALLLACARARALGFAVVRFRDAACSRWIDVRINPSEGDRMDLLVSRSHGAPFSHLTDMTEQDLEARCSVLVASGYHVDKTW